MVRHFFVKNIIYFAFFFFISIHDVLLDCCEKTFCLDHRSYSAHKCPLSAMKKDSLVFSCPICAETLSIGGGKDANDVFQLHQNSGLCDASKASGGKKIKKPRCPVNGCREKLTISNKVTCPSK